MQYYILSNLGYKIKQVNLIHLNNKYYREDFLDINQLFKINNITDKVIQNQEQVKENLEYFEKILNEKKEPNIYIGVQCFNPYDCDCYDYCWNEQRNLCEKENVLAFQD